jgi:ABC-type nitrate/sulfonate/bicarbonate transport system substrate-binding protein
MSFEKTFGRVLFSSALLSSFTAMNFAHAKEKLSVCMSDWPPLVLGHALSKAGKIPDVKFTLADQATCMKRFEKGLEDVIPGAPTEYIHFRNKKTPFMIAGLLDYSFGGDGVVLKKGLKPSDLKGKSFGLQADSTSVVAFGEYLKKIKLSMTDVTVIDIKAENVAKAISAGKVTGGVVTWVPTLQEAEKNGGEIVFTTREAPEVIFDTIFALNSALKSKEKKAILKDYLEKYHKASTDPEMHKLAAEKLKVTPAEYKDMLEKDMKVYGTVAEASAAVPKFKKVVLETLTYLDTPALRAVIPVAKDIPTKFDTKYYEDCCVPNLN